MDRDIGKAHAIANSVRAGTVWVNCYDVFDAALRSADSSSQASAANSANMGCNYTEVKTVTVKL